MQGRNQAENRNEGFIRRVDDTTIRLEMPPTIRSRNVHGFNDLEQVVGDYAPADVTAPSVAFVWTERITYDLRPPDLSALETASGCSTPSTPVNGAARAINNRGIAVGEAWGMGGCGGYPVRWQSSVPTLLATFQGSAEGITEGGVIWGSDVIWKGGGYEVVTSPDGKTVVAAVNERGQVVVAITPPQDPMRAFGPTLAEIRDPDGTSRRLQPLPSLPGVEVSDFNDLGIAVGSSWKGSGWMETERYDARAVYWLREPAIDLNLLLEGAAPTVLREAWFLNGRGRIVALGADGVFYLLTPRGNCFPR
ncbi:MAG TPA: hypothetical protein VGK67_32880 [Myxococcales bacterium]